MMSHVGFSHLLLRFSMLFLLLLAPVVSGCVEAGLQSGVFACNTDSECPPGGFFCDNYFNTYVYYSDVTARPTVHGFWGFCNSDSEVIPKSSSPKVYAETCNNRKDDDGDELADCDDTDCQTAPACKRIIQDQCISQTGAGFDCDGRLGFPYVRPANETAETDHACPLAVGYHSPDPELNDFFVGTTMNGVCLPRCRLYFRPFITGMADNDEDDFLGSDAYCTEVVKSLGTAAPFQGPMKCVHLDREDNTAGVPHQIDVCVPAGTGSSCSTCSDDCLRVTYRERLYLAVPPNQTPGSRLVATSSVHVTNNEVDGQVVEFCVAPSF